MRRRRASIETAGVHERHAGVQPRHRCALRLTESLHRAGGRVARLRRGLEATGQAEDIGAVPLEDRAPERRTRTAHATARVVGDAESLVDLARVSKRVHGHCERTRGAVHVSAGPQVLGSIDEQMRGLGRRAGPLQGNAPPRPKVRGGQGVFLLRRRELQCVRRRHRATGIPEVDALKALLPRRPGNAGCHDAPREAPLVGPACAQEPLDGTGRCFVHGGRHRSATGGVRSSSPSSSSTITTTSRVDASRRVLPVPWPSSARGTVLEPGSTSSRAVRPSAPPTIARATVAPSLAGLLGHLHVQGRGRVLEAEQSFRAEAAGLRRERGPGVEDQVGEQLPHAGRAFLEEGMGASSGPEGAGLDRLGTAPGLDQITGTGDLLGRSRSASVPAPWTASTARIRRWLSEPVTMPPSGDSAAPFP